MPSCLGDKFARVPNTNEIVGEDECSAPAEVSGSVKDLL
jgi:hypothetical protein